LSFCQLVHLRRIFWGYLDSLALLFIPEHFLEVRLMIFHGLIKEDHLFVMLLDIVLHNEDAFREEVQDLLQVQIFLVESVLIAEVELLVLVEEIGLPHIKPMQHKEQAHEASNLKSLIL